jgi:hypothetical protein
VSFLRILVEGTRCGRVPTRVAHVSILVVYVPLSTVRRLVWQSPLGGLTRVVVGQRGVVGDGLLRADRFWFKRLEGSPQRLDGDVLRPCIRGVTYLGSHPVKA